MRDLYRRNGLEPYESDTQVLERALVGATEEVEAGRQILLHPHRKALYDRYHADLKLLGDLRSELHLADAPFCRVDELGDFHVAPSRPEPEPAPAGDAADPAVDRHRGARRQGSRLRHWAGRVLVVAALGLLVAFQTGVRLPWVSEESQASGGGPAQPPGPEDDGNRRFVVGDMIAIHDKPTRKAPVVGQLQRFDIVHIDPRAGGWARLLNRGQAGFVDTRLLAARSECWSSGLGRPENGAVLHAGMTGSNGILVRNDSGRDALIKVSNYLGGSELSLFVRAGSTAGYHKLPGGNFRFEYATGTDFSPYCGAFMNDMVASAADTALRLPDKGKGEVVSYTIQGAAHGNFASGRILLDAF